MQTMKKIALIITLLAVGWECFAQKPFPLETGDLLFQVTGRSAYTEAISSVTRGIKDLNFTHVGVAYVEDGKTYVLEAVPYGVVKSPLEKFFRDAQKSDGNPVVVVGRLKPRLRRCIPAAIEKIKTLLNKRYDFVFDPDDDDYYCSELIYVSYLKPNGKSIFKMKPMTFRDKQTGEISPLWVEHFKRYKCEIPEGVPGTNPGDMSRSKAIRIVHHYF